MSPRPLPAPGHRIVYFLALLLLLATVAPVTPALALETSIRVTSDADDPIGLGAEFYFSDGIAAFTAGENQGEITLTADPLGPGDVWVLQFQAPSGNLLQPGLYVEAGLPSPSSPRPGLHVAATGRDCSQLTGRFEIREIDLGGNGVVNSFRAIFEQHCDGQTPALRGEICYRASVPLRVDAPRVFRVPRGEYALFFAFLMDEQWRFGSLTAGGLPPGADFVDYSDNSGGFYWSTTPEDVGRWPVTITGQVEGMNESTESLVEILGDERLALVSEPGEPLLQGNDLAIGGWEGLFRATEEPGGLTLTCDNGAGEEWSLGLRFPAGEAPAEGYDGPAGLDIRRNGVPAAPGNGWLSLREFRRDGDGYLLSVRAAFEERDPAGPALRGEIWYNASAMVSVMAPAAISAKPGEPVAFDVSGFDLRGDPPALSAAGLPAGAVFRDGGAGTGTFEWTPAADQAGPAEIKFLAGAGDGRGDGATTRIEVTATEPPPLDARAWVTAPNRELKLFTTRPWYSIQIEPFKADFLLADVDLSSLAMVSPGTGSVERVPAWRQRTTLDRDNDRNGVPELAVAFDSGALRPLFDHVAAPATLPVTIEGRLRDGQRIAATLDLSVFPFGGPPISTHVQPPGRSLTLDLAEPATVTIQLFDLSGRLVQQLHPAPLSAGTHAIPIDGVRPGIYFYRAATPAGETFTGRLTITH